MRRTKQKKGCDTEISSASATPQQVRQGKLSAGTVNDAMEGEADAIAEQVMRIPVSAYVQRKEEADASVVNDGVERPGTGGGEKMDGTTQSFMETRFGTDFSGVRIHTGNEAVQMNRKLGAQAFTIGNDIYFNSGKYAPGTDSGNTLLAHELVHTLQQQAMGPAIQLKRELDKVTEKDEYDKCLARIGAVITTLEGNMSKPGISAESQEAVKQLRYLYNENKIKCCYLDGRDGGVTNFTNGEICMDAKRLKDNPDTFANIGETSLLHEGIHSGHTKKYPKATGRYGKLLEEQEAGKKIMATEAEANNLKRLKAWTEYWAYRRMKEYNNAKQSITQTDDEIHSEIIKDERVRKPLNEVYIFDQTFDPRTWKPAG